MKYSKYFLIIALLGIVTSCSDFLDRTNPNEPDNVTFWVNEDQLENALPPCYEALQKDYLVNWTESTAETVMWGNITSGLSKVSGGKHSSAWKSRRRDVLISSRKSLFRSSCRTFCR